MFELKEPDEEGRREFVLTNATIAVSFKKDSEGKVLGLLVMHESGMSFELPWGQTG